MFSTFFTAYRQNILSATIYILGNHTYKGAYIYIYLYARLYTGYVREDV